LTGWWFVVELLPIQESCKAVETPSLIKTDQRTVSQQTYKFCIAPMMDWTDRHCRFFHRSLSRHARLYTEMVTAEAVLHGDRDRLLGLSSSCEHPVTLQLGGSEPELLAEAASIGAAFGYDEINLNVGCPSDRVQSGRFGACLMREPEHVGRCVAAMQAAVDVPVTVKCRIGVDDQDSENDLQRFIDTVADAGCRTFIVHARKAWLRGLSPKQNREVPPLNYGRVARLKAARPQLTIVLNGGLDTLSACEEGLKIADGVMVGRAAYQTPYLLADVDQRLFAVTSEAVSRADALRALIPYAEAELAQGTRLSSITRHIMGLYHGQPGGRLFRRHLSEKAILPGAGVEVLFEALDIVEAVHARQNAIQVA
jgi:tRNA-dihydrouridine synthase A